MTRKLVSRLLRKYDQVFGDAKLDAELREEYLTTFCELSRQHLRNVFAEFVIADKRIETEEKNGGFMVSFEGRFLFRVAVVKYSERMEVVIDGERYLQFDGSDPHWVDNFSESAPPVILVTNAVMKAFRDALERHLKKQINNL